MTDRYWKETECEHGCSHAHESRRCAQPQEAAHCSGGNRVELFPATPNYEAGEDLYSTQAGESGWIHRATRVVVDASLVGVVLLQEQ